MTRAVPAQEALRNSMAGHAAAEARRVRPESLPYTFKSGDLRMLVTPAVGLDWNDNIYTSKTGKEDDFILRPELRFNLNYPISRYNLLFLDAGFGYDHYFEHDELSTWRLGSGSGVSLDIYVKDFWINLHDRFQYAQDSAQEAAVANTARYGTFENTVGLSVTWDLQDVTLSAGYDHLNVISPQSEFKVQDRAAELLFARAGLQVHPRVLVGLEGTASFTKYQQSYLNDNTGYSLGAYADWRPGAHFRVQPRGGYSLYRFDQTSQFIKADDRSSSWYADLTVTHQPTDILSYSFSAGRERRPGVQSDLIEDTYVRWRGNWGLLKSVTLATSLSYEHGELDGNTVNGNFSETYDWFGGSVGLSYAFMKAASVSLNYRLTLRASDEATREYTQNLIQLQLTYRP
ncbi:MAG: outer membrane beta-barrel protein [Verrucomicrobiae bacterium]|nr:outer membrane beta-barrel protein [Verrucomicrobiae bacterium]